MYAVPYPGKRRRLCYRLPSPAPVSVSISTSDNCNAEKTSVLKMRVSPTSKELPALNRERRDFIPGFVTLPRKQKHLVYGNVPPRMIAESFVNDNDEETLVESSLGIDIEEGTELESFCTKSQDDCTRSQDDGTKSQDGCTLSQDEDAAGKSFLGVGNAEFSRIERGQTELIDSYGHPRYPT